MKEYVKRRGQAWRKMLELDDSFAISETIKGEMLLDAAGLTKIEKQLVVSSTLNHYEYDVVAKALQEQHERLHEEERGKGGYRG